MVSRALDFANAHPVADGGFTTVVTRLTATVTRGDTMARQENVGDIEESAALARRTKLKQSIRAIKLRRLVSIAEIAVETHPELAGLFTMPDFSMPNHTFLLAAQSLLEAIPPHQDLFTSLGLGDTFVADLTQATSDMDSTTGTAHGGRSDHVGAHVDLKTVVRSAKRDVVILNTYYREQNAEGSDVLAAWDSARNLRTATRHPADTPEPVPAPEPEPVPVILPMPDSDEPLK